MRTSGGGRSRVSVMPQPSNTINVQPGDVVGYDVAGFAGIQFDNSFRDETVWYNEAPLPTTQGLACPYPVASQSDWILTSSTNAGPLLSVHLGEYFPLCSFIDLCLPGDSMCKSSTLRHL